MRTVPGVFLVLAAAWVAAGCSAGSQSPGSCDGGCPLSPADEQFLTSLCELSESCCSKNGSTYLDPTNCKSFLSQINGPSRDPSLRAACLAELRQIAPTAACLPDQGKLDDPCVRLFNEPGGSSPPGGNCHHTADCAGTPGTITFCQENTAGWGICMRMARGQAGQGTCLGHLLETGGPSAPWFLSAAWPPPLTEGLFCDHREGLTCILSMDLNAQTCMPFLADGAACLLHEDCASEKCSDTDTCIPHVPDGASCAGVVLCNRGSYCKASSGGTATCAPKEPPGASCQSNDVCATDMCRSGTCQGISFVASQRFCH